MPFKIIRDDITKVKVDAIVNAANPGLLMGGGVSGAIFSAAGDIQLQKECNDIGGCDTGEAVITSGYNLPAKHIIHTVGPIWQGGKRGEKKLLHDCYINSMKLALESHCETIAFPLIASGIYGYPKDKALNIALSSISEFLEGNELTVYLVIYDKQAFEVSKTLLNDIDRYIDDNYVDTKLKLYSRDNRIRESLDEVNAIEANFYSEKKSEIEEFKVKLEETFSEMLLRLIDEKKLTDSEAYNKSNIDRKLFSKIRSNKFYHPSRNTGLAFAIGLKLSLEETLDLLGKAGFILSHSSKFDLIIEYFIKNGIYDIHEINVMLFEHDQPLLGA